jgi:hypothetical protein
MRRLLEFRSDARTGEPTAGPPQTTDPRSKCLPSAHSCSRRGKPVWGQRGADRHCQPRSRAHSGRRGYGSVTASIASYFLRLLGACARAENVASSCRWPSLATGGYAGVPRCFPCRAYHREIRPPLGAHPARVAGRVAACLSGGKLRSKRRNRSTTRHSSHQISSPVPNACTRWHQAWRRTAAAPIAPRD